MGAQLGLEQAARMVVARAPAELERIVPAWEALARAALEPNPFYEPWMLLPALRAFGGGQDLRVAQVWIGEELAGLFPFERVPGYKGLPLPTLRSWRHAHCLLCTPLVRRDVAGICLEALFSGVNASFIEFAYLPVEEPFHRALARFKPVATREYARPLLRKHGWTMSGNLRRRLARHERSLGKLGALERVALRAGDDGARWIDDFLALEASGWKGRNGSALACKDANRGYAAEIFGAALRRGRLIGCGLDLDGRPIARRLSFTAGEGAYAFKTAYDERYADFSPGVLLEADNLRQVDADPQLQWMDSFTEDDNLALRRMWSAGRRMQHVLVARGAWGRAAAAALPALRWLKAKYSRAQARSVKIAHAACAVADTAGARAARTVGP